MKIIVTDKQHEFLSKLKALLKEYNMSITCDIQGDTHGINEDMTIEDDSKSEVFFRLEYRCSLSHHDIELL